LKSRKLPFCTFRISGAWSQCCWSTFKGAFACTFDRPSLVVSPSSSSGSSFCGAQLRFLPPFRRHIKIIQFWSRCLVRALALLLRVVRDPFAAGRQLFTGLQDCTVRGPKVYQIATHGLFKGFRWLQQGLAVKSWKALSMYGTRIWTHEGWCFWDSLRACASRTP